MKTLLMRRYYANIFDMRQEDQLSWMYEVEENVDDGHKTFTNARKLTGINYFERIEHSLEVDLSKYPKGCFDPRKSYPVLTKVVLLRKMSLRLGNRTFRVSKMIHPLNLHRLQTLKAKILLAYKKNLLIRLPSCLTPP